MLFTTYFSGLINSSKLINSNLLGTRAFSSSTSLNSFFLLPNEEKNPFHTEIIEPKEIDKYFILFLFNIQSNSAVFTNVFTSISALPYVPNRDTCDYLLDSCVGLKGIFYIIQDQEEHTVKTLNNKFISGISLKDLLKLLTDLRTNSPEQFRQVMETSCFISVDYTWETICNSFKDNNFSVTGDLSTKRHIISPSARRLSFILDFLRVPFDFTNNAFHQDEKLLIKGNPLTKITKNKKPSNKREYSTDTRNSGYTIDDFAKQKIYFNYSPVYNVIKEKLNDLNKKTNVEVQLEIEKFLHSTWIDIVNYKIDHIPESGSTSSESFKFLHSHVIELQDHLLNSRKDNLKKQKKSKNPEFIPSFKPLFELDITKIAAVVFNAVVPLLNNHNNITKNELLMILGNKLFDIWSLEEYDRKYLISNVKNRPVYAESRESFKEFKLNLNIKEVHKGNLGEFLLHELIDMGSLIETEVKPIENTKRSETIIKPSTISIKLFEKSFEVIGFKLPMVCEPISWDDENDGGYLLNRTFHFDDIIHQGFNNVKPTIIDDKINVYGQINYMSKIPFKINKKILNYILEKGVENGLVLSSLHEKTDTIEKLESFERKEVLAHNSRYYQEKNILGIAQLFQDVDKFYFPLFFDWRGRIYTNTSYLHYQSTPLAKALIEFANGDNLNETKFNNKDLKESDKRKEALYWLSVYGANCFGKGCINLDENKFTDLTFKPDLSKLSFSDRLNWIKSAEKYIMNLDNNFWLKADEPILFLAFCFEYQKISSTLLSSTHLPIQLDATCNGLQHLSIMSANQNLARLVNLLPNSNEEKPEDLYSVVLDLIKEKVDDLIIKEPLFINLKYINIDRKMIKRPVMTIPYNVKLNGVVEQLSEFFHKKYIDGTYLYIPKKEIHGTKYISGKDLFKLASIIHSTLYETHPELQKVVSYFKEMVNLMTELNLPIAWITPAGLEINQKYTQRKSTRIRSGSFKGASYYIVIPTDKIDKVSQESAFMPNLIHSMDGSTITLLVKKLRFLGVYNLYTIHDCFATTANNIGLVNELVRESFCEIYANDDFLINLHKFFISYLKGNYKILFNNKIIDENTVISKQMINEGQFTIVEKGETKVIPNLPKTGKFSNLKESIKNAIYLIS